MIRFTIFNFDIEKSDRKNNFDLWKIQVNKSVHTIKIIQCGERRHIKYKPRQIRGFRLGSFKCNSVIVD